MATMPKYSKVITAPIKTETKHLALVAALTAWSAKRKGTQSDPLDLLLAMSKSLSAQSDLDAENTRYANAISAKMESLLDHFQVQRAEGVPWTQFAPFLAIRLAEEYIPGFGERDESDRRGPKKKSRFWPIPSVDEVKKEGAQSGLALSDRQALKRIIDRERERGKHPHDIRTLQNQLSNERKRWDAVQKSVDRGAFRHDN
jgi:hypothetical protein